MKNDIPKERMKVFLSHAEADESAARNLASGLSKAGFDVWYPEKARIAGENGWLRVGKALEESAAMVVLLSPDSVHSPWVTHEIEYALGSAQFKNRLIPVIIRPTKAEDIPWILQKLPLIRVSKGKSIAINRIIRHLQKRGKRS